MKATAAILLVLGLVACAAGKMIVINLAEDTSGVTRSISDRPVTETELNSLLVRLGRIDTNQLIVVNCRSNVFAGTLIATLTALQEARLKNIVIYSPGTKIGTNGFYTLTIQTTVLPIATDTMKLPTGFEPMTTQENVVLPEGLLE